MSKTNRWNRSSSFEPSQRMRLHSSIDDQVVFCDLKTNKQIVRIPLKMTGCSGGT